MDLRSKGQNPRDTAPFLFNSLNPDIKIQFYYSSSREKF